MGGSQAARACVELSHPAPTQPTVRIRTGGAGRLPRASTKRGKPSGPTPPAPRPRGAARPLVCSRNELVVNAELLGAAGEGAVGGEEAEGVGGGGGEVEGVEDA